MKKVFISFNYLFIEHEVDTNIDNCIISSVDDDFIIFVMNEDSTVSDFHDADVKFTEQFNLNYIESSDYYINQSRSVSVDIVTKRMNKIKQEVEQILSSDIDVNMFSKYELK